jgi:hypothetical protein
MLKAACWIPIVGMLFEGLHLELTGKNYLSDPTNNVRWWGSLLWHSVFLGILLGNGMVYLFN